MNSAFESSTTDENIDVNDAFLSAAFDMPQDESEDNDDAREDTFYGKEAVRGDTFVSLAEWDESLCARDASFMISPTTKWGGNSSWKRNYHPGEAGWIPEKCTWIEFASTFAKPQTP